MAQASAIYDPQQQAEGVALDRAKAGREADLSEEEATIDPFYNDAIKGAKQTRNEEGARTDHLYSTALSGMGSGLQGNQQRILGEKLIEQEGKFNTERNTKKGNISTRRRLVGEDYTAGMSALAAKYSGIKSAFVREAEIRDEDFARQDRQRREDRAFASSQSASDRAFQLKLKNMDIAAAAAAKPTPAQNAKAEAIAYLENAHNTRSQGKSVDTFYRDNVYKVLKSKYGSELGDSDIKNLVYNEVFKKGWM